MANGNGGSQESSHANGHEEQETQSSTAIVVSPTATMESYRRGFEPKDIDVAMKMCGAVAATGICGLKSQEEAFIRVVAGRELGLSFMQSIQGVYVVEGKPSLYAEVMESLCTAHPDCEVWEWKERTNERVTLYAKRRGGREATVTWTLEDAKKAGLLKPNSNWEKYPRRMLTARCRSEMAGLLFADVMRGIRSRDDAEDERGEAPARTNVAARLAAPPSAPDAQEALVKKLLHSLLAVSNKEQKEAIQAEIEKAKTEGLLTGLHLAEVIDAYNARFAKKKAEASNGATQAATPAATQTPAAEG